MKKITQLLIKLRPFLAGPRSVHGNRSAILGAFVKVLKASNSFVMSVCLSASLPVSPSTWNNSAAIGRIFIKFNIRVSFKNLSRTFRFHYNVTRITVTLHEDLRTFMIVTPWIIVRMKNFLEIRCRKKIKTHVVFFLLGNYPASGFYMPTFRNTLSVQSS